MCAVAPVRVVHDNMGAYARWINPRLCSYGSDDLAKGRPNRGVCWRLCGLRLDTRQIADVVLPSRHRRLRVLRAGGPADARWRYPYYAG